jgi:protein SCO1/2
MVLFTSCEKKIKKENIKVTETSRVDYLPYYNEESFTPKWIVPNTEEEKSFHKIPDFNLFNQLGDTISQKTFEGKIYVTDFFFTTCPGICPKMTGNMQKLQEEFLNDSDVLLLSHSVMPTTDSIPILKEYAKNYNVIDNKWHLVTGDKKVIYDLGRDNYFVENDLGEVKDINDFLHTENFLLIDKNKHIRGIYNGLNRASVQQLIIDIKTLQKED